MEYYSKPVPKPRIVAYRVEYYEVKSDRATGRQHLALVGHDVFSADDLVDRLSKPTAWLAGWQEAHYYYEQSLHPSGVPVDTLKIAYADKVHPINQALLRDIQEELDAHPNTILNITKHQSYEGILLSLGWGGEMEVKENPDDLPHNITDSIRASLEHVPSLNKYIRPNPLVYELPKPGPAPIQQEAPPAAPTYQGPLDMLTLKIDRLTDAIGLLLHEKLNGATTGQPRPTSEQPEGRIDYSFVSDEAQADTLVNQQG